MDQYQSITDPSPRRSARHWMLAVGILAAGAALYCAWVARQRHTSEVAISATEQGSQQLEQAQRALEDLRYEEAEQLAVQVLETNQHSVAALLIAAQAAARNGQTEKAHSWYSRLQRAGDRETLAAHHEAADFYHRQRNLGRAEHHLQAILEYQPTEVAANTKLAALLVAEGRRWESLRPLLAIVQSKEFALEQLILLGDPHQRPDFSKLLLEAYEAYPDDPMPKLGLAHAQLGQGNTAMALRLLRSAVQAAPQQMDAQALLGELLLSKTPAEFLAWHERLPALSDESPQIWYVRGQFAENLGQVEPAVRCYWESVRREPNDPRTLHRLAQALEQIGRGDQLGAFQTRAELLEELHAQLRTISRHGPQHSEMRRAAELCTELGRWWEAWGWYTAIAAYFPNDEGAIQEREELASRLAAESLPQTVPEGNPAHTVDLSDYELPPWMKKSGGQAVVASESTQLRFREVAQASGLEFQFVNGDDLNEPGTPIYLQMGGGVVVLDYDADNWPDLYVTQGGPWPCDPASSQYPDRLYRNCGDGRFIDVTSAAGLGDTHYSQGATTGDFNNDGFPDLFIANIGVNRLYQNNGDGTFTDVTASAQLSAERWSTSCLIADLNGDRLPDLYEVNYLAGRQPFETVCRDGPHVRSCKPDLFAAEPDHLYLNLGDGRFQDVSRSAGIDSVTGKGLGIVAADFDQSGRLSLFIANDSSPNDFYRNHQSVRGSAPQFQNDALSWGLAFDESGISRACMGVAIDDANHDSYLDLVVTNFEGERNNFYWQQPDFYFVDDPHRAGIAEASYPVLGFGTQFLDADLDGQPDLVVANGHIDDFRYLGKPYKMRPQVFRNLGQGRFAEISSPEPGEYFAGEYLGRSLARLDWNRDGRDDFVVLHLDVPLALLSNETPQRHHGLRLKFRGVDTARDAIGVRIELTAGGRTYYKQLTAGDGFYASNERQLTLGLADAAQAERLVVRWPSGLVQQFENVPADRQLLLIEGRELLELDRSPRF